METENHEQSASAARVREHFSQLTLAEFRDLTRRLVLYAARLLRGASLDHHAYEIVTGAIDLALDGTRKWDPSACPFQNFIFGVVRSRVSTLRRSMASQLVKIEAQLPPADGEYADILDRFADESPQAHTAIAVEQEQEMERLILDVANIDPTLAKILVLAIYEDKCNIEIATALSLSVRDVENGKKRLQRALKKIYGTQIAPITDSGLCH